MRADVDIKRDVEAELQWSPEFDEQNIVTKMEDGIVLLTGFVHDNYEKYQVEGAVKRVKGVAAVANDLQVKAGVGNEVADPEVARNAVAALKSALPMTWDRIKVIVNQGRLTLE